jgi:hypothetical protein
MGTNGGLEFIKSVGGKGYTEEAYQSKYTGSSAGILSKL